MKTLLTVLTSTLLTTSTTAILGSINQTTINNSISDNIKEENTISKINSTSNSIVNPLNFSFYRLGPISSGQTEDNRIITLINYKQYADSWGDFTNKYHTLNLLNFDGESGGQGQTVKTQSYEVNTKDIAFGKVTRPVNYYKNYVFGYQRGIIEFTFFDRGGFVGINADFYTSSSNGVYHVWISLSISDAIFN